MQTLSKVGLMIASVLPARRWSARAIPLSSVWRSAARRVLRWWRGVLPTASGQESPSGWLANRTVGCHWLPPPTASPSPTTWRSIVVSPPLSQDVSGSGCACAAWSGGGLLCKATHRWPAKSTSPGWWPCCVSGCSAPDAVPAGAGLGGVVPRSHPGCQRVVGGSPYAPIRAGGEPYAV